MLCLSTNMSLKRKIINDNRKDGNSNNHEHFIAIAATVLTLALMMATSSMAITPVAATPTTTSNTTAATTSSSSGIEVSSEPIFQERSPPGNITPINETHGVLTFTGNGTLTLPNTTQTINTTSNGTAIISFATSSGYGKETITAANGESATATLYEIVQFNNPATAPEGGGKGIIIAVFQTNSTSGTLAPLNGMIAAGTDDLTSSGESHITLWQWESGISSNSGVSTSPSTNTSSTQGTPSTNSNSNTTTTNEASQPSSSSPLTSLY
jgi:hypothetical protein